MKLTERRTAGVLVPLFSLRAADDWGVGEFPHLGAIAPWMQRARLQLLMTLPLLEVALGQSSPYGALSAFALEPLYLRLDDIDQFEQLGGERALSRDDRLMLERARAAPAVDYGSVRRLKEKWLRRCFERFLASGAASGTPGRELAQFRDRHAAWLPDYSLFRAMKQATPTSWWRAWDTSLQQRDPAALADARARLANECLYYEWLQWLAHHQLGEARTEARRHGVFLGGDLPFMVAEDSADAWARQHELHFDATVGVPPDAYSAEGQDWGLPGYRWDSIAKSGYEWLRRRGESSAEAFDLVRVDHVVGFFRTYLRPRGPGAGAPYFSPAEENAQTRQGEAVMAALRQGGAELIAEDLGTVPPFVRQSLTGLGIPGFRVLRWEKDGETFRDPAVWPALSVATTGTHDTEPAAVWWEGMSPTERAAIRALPAFHAIADAEASRFSRRIHEALLEAVFGSGSNLLLLPIQDAFGLRERINTPGTVGAMNWSWRLPWACTRLLDDPTAREATDRLARLSGMHGRAAAGPEDRDLLGLPSSALESAGHAP